MNPAGAAPALLLVRVEPLLHGPSCESQSPSPRRRLDGLKSSSSTAPRPTSASISAMAALLRCRGEVVVGFACWPGDRALTRKLGSRGRLY